MVPKLLSRSFAMQREMLDALTKLGRRRNISRSEIVRRAVWQYLRDEQKREQKVLYVQEYDI
jgi:metal-responsive CopG/Arc/MetJ family transcriptional regulator